MKYILIGPPDPESEDALYWSNEDGWGCLQTATPFPQEIFTATLPLETVAIAELLPDGTLGNIYTLQGEGRVYKL